MEIKDLPICTKILEAAYSQEPYNEKFINDSAEKYLSIKYYNYSDNSFVLENDGNIIAFIILQISFWGEGKQAIIEEIVVDPNFQRKGFGRQLMEHSLRYFKSLGITSVMLWAKNNERLVNFYKRNDFFVADDFVVMFKNN